MKFRKLLRITILTFVISACFALPAFAAKTVASAEDTTLANGIHVQGVDLSGMSVEQANEALRAKAAQMAATPVNLIMGDNVITTTLETLGYTWKNTDIVNSLTGIGKSGNIVERYKEQKDLENNTIDYPLTFRTDKDRVSEFVQNCTVYNTDPVEGTIQIGQDGYPYVEGGTNGLTLRVEDSVKKVRKAIRNWDGSDLSIELEYDTNKPYIGKETLEQVRDILGQATTDYSASSGARATNVENGCRLINGSLVWPGEEFSVTDMLVPFSAENGYQPAPTYEENRTVDSYGGGICQVSTTLYNAVLKAELEVTARSNHTMMVAYVEPSKDAAIAEGVMDFRFVNNSDAPIYLEGYCSGGQITFVIFGHETRPANRTLNFESRVLSTTQPDGFRLYPDATQNVGYVMQTQSPHTGYTAELWKQIYIDGVLTDEYCVNQSVYQAVGTIYSVGVVSPNPSVQQAMYGAIASNNLEAVQQIIQTGQAAAQQQVDPVTGQPLPQANASGDIDDNTAPASGNGDIVIVQ